MTIGIVDDPTAVPMTPMDIARLRISGLYCGWNELNYYFEHIFMERSFVSRYQWLSKVGS